MIIKIWNNRDKGVYRVHVSPNAAEDAKKMFSPKEQKELRRIGKELAEELVVVFVHNLRRGWERKILAAGKVSDKDGKRELKTFEEIKESLSSDGEIRFNARRKNGSLSFIRSIGRPAHLQWA